MPPSLPIDLANFPSLRTRKALLILDLQNEFLSPGGPLSVTTPNGFVQRTLAVARAFRSSNSGDVFWIRSQFESHRPSAETHIIVTDKPQLSKSSRRQQHELPSDDQDADPEAFLSIGGQAPEEKETQAKKLYPGSIGSELLPEVASSVDACQDLVLAKTHYSAFQCSQLLVRLRTHFVTELYICGSLTNVSVYATALDAARHGLALSLIEDCCGYRSEVRHNNAVTSLVQLTGCETVDSGSVIESLESAPIPVDKPGHDNRAASGAAAGLPGTSGRPKARQSVRQAPEGSIEVGSSGGATTAAHPSGSLPVRTKAPASDALEKKKGKDKMEPDEGALGPSESCSESPSHDESHKLSRVPSVADAVVSKAVQPQPSTSVQPVAAAALNVAEPTKTMPTTSSNAENDFESAKADIISTYDDGSIITHDDESLKRTRQSIEALAAKSRELARTRSKHRDAANKAASRSSEKKNAKKDSNVSGEKPVLKTAEDLSLSAPAAMGVKQEPNEDAGDSPTNTAKPADPKADTAVPLATHDESAEKLTATEPFCEGDTVVYHNVLPPSIEDGIYDRLCEEVHWMRMSHQGGEVPRLVCVQGDMDEDGNMPIYRHPADESPPLEAFSPTVLKIKARIEAIVGHPLNHALIQLYRTGHDYISEHSDKTLDIVPGSYICNVSLGAERTMIFRTKKTNKDRGEDGQEAEKMDGKSGAEDDTHGGKKRQVCRVQLPHNSLCRMGLQTNMRWLHAIRQDKRMERDKTAAELAYGGGRISLTFRQIGTFMNSDQTRIWGQGARSASQDSAGTVVNGQTEEAIRMLKAFGTENHSSEFDWKKNYGEGFDVLHMNTAARLFSSGDTVANLSIQLMLAELGLGYAKGSMSGGATGRKKGDGEQPRTSVLDLPVRFADRDGSVVDGVLAIMLYLDSVHGTSKPKALERLEMAHTFTRLQQALNLQDKWRAAHKAAMTATAATTVTTPSIRSLISLLGGELEMWNGYASAEKCGPAGFIGGGSAASLADFAFWPVLHELEKACDEGEDGLAAELKQAKLDHLAEYFNRFKAREKVQHACSS